MKLRGPYSTFLIVGVLAGGSALITSRIVGDQRTKVVEDRTIGEFTPSMGDVETPLPIPEPLSTQSPSGDSILGPSSEGEASFRKSHARQYARWMATVDAGSPLADLIDQAYATESSDLWDFAANVMTNYERMMASPEDVVHGPPLETGILGGLMELPPSAIGRLSMGPVKCRSAACLIQIAELTGAGPNGTSMAVLGRVYEVGKRMNTGAGSSFGRVNVLHRVGHTFVFVDRAATSNASEK